MEMLLIVLSIVMSGVAIFIANRSSQVKIENGTVKKENLVFKRDLSILSNRLDDVANQNKEIWNIYSKQNTRLSALEKENEELKGDVFVLNEAMLILKKENKDLTRRLETIEQLSQYARIDKSFTTKLG